jgi:hypothetical protein
MPRLGVKQFLMIDSGYSARIYDCQKTTWVLNTKKEPEKWTVKGHAIQLPNVVFKGGDISAKEQKAVWSLLSSAATRLRVPKNAMFFSALDAAFDYFTKIETPVGRIAVHPSATRYLMNIFQGFRPIDHGDEDFSVIGLFKNIVVVQSKSVPKNALFVGAEPDYLGIYDEIFESKGEKCCAAMVFPKTIVRVDFAPKDKT